MFPFRQPVQPAQAPIEEVITEGGAPEAQTEEEIKGMSEDKTEQTE